MQYFDELWTLAQPNFSHDIIIRNVMWAMLNDRRTPKYVDPNWMDFFEFAMARPQSHGQLFQDAWALWKLKEKRNGYFVEFGACTGKDHSNTFILERDYGWNGVVAEPNPIFHEQLLANRKCNISLDCVYSESGLTTEFRCVAIPELSAISLVDPADFFGSVRDDYKPVQVNTISLTDLLASFNAPREIDFLSIDTEGSELAILQAHDFDRYRFSLIAVEHNSTPRREEIKVLLESKGYKREFELFTGFDDWYCLEELANPPR